MSSDSKTLNNGGSLLPKDEQSNTKSSMPSSLGRESSSICSFTLGEFQQTLFDDGKNIGSMNMDDFLNICTTEEEEEEEEEENNTNDDDPLIDLNNKPSSSNQHNPRSETKIIPNTQQILRTRQGSLTLPTLLPMKTVEEVWSEMNKDQQQFNELRSSGNIDRQLTLGEMSLEDFLIKAGVVVRKTCGGSSSSSQSQMKNSQSNRQLESVQVRPIYQTNYNSNMHPKVGIGFSDTSVSSGAIPQGGLIVGDPKLESGFHRGMWSGAFGMISPGGMCTNQVFNSAKRLEVEVSGKRGKKRVNEGPIWEKVVERRQRRMIKNREAASRSRARKQAYTVELEAALDKLKEENARLNQTLLQDNQEKHPNRKMPMITEKPKLLRRMWSFPLMESG